MAIQEKQLGQTRPGVGGTAESAYSPGSGVTAIIKGIFIANVSGSEVTVSVYVDDNGTTYNQTTAIIFNAVLAVGTFIDISTFIAMNDSSGNIAVECDNGNGANFTIFGAEIT